MIVNGWLLSCVTQEFLVGRKRKHLWLSCTEEELTATHSITGKPAKTKIVPKNHEKNMTAGKSEHEVL